MAYCVQRVSMLVGSAIEPWSSSGESADLQTPPPAAHIAHTRGRANTATHFYVNLQPNLQTPPINAHTRMTYHT